MIMDTCFVIDLMNKDAKAIEKIEILSKRGEQLFTTSITIFELISGVFRGNKLEKEKAKIVEILNGQLILNLDEKSAEKAGQIDGKLIKEGNQIKPLDCMISGIVLNKKDKIITRNLKDFSRVPNLEIENY